MENTLKVQIWSDVMCPFCYIGKRKLESALNQFDHTNRVEIEWKSFELDAKFKASPDDNIIAHLSKKYGRDEAWAKEMTDNMTENAKLSGLDFHFDKAVLANSHNAHRLLHLAKKYQLGNELKELLFKAYLTEGKNLNAISTLSALGQEVGLEKTMVEEVLHSNAYSDAVKNDIAIAQQIGIQGVPFFVFDNKYAISGAQPDEVFLQTLQKVWEEGAFESEVTLLNTNDGDSCGLDACN
jgi:predicted DsbA family dithiol-disulfide isomerase